MKKTILLPIIFLLTVSVFASEYLLSTEKCWTFNSYSSTMAPAKIEIKYETEIAKGYLFRYDNAYYMLSEESLKSLRAVCEKYFEWEEIAIKNEAVIQKEIPIRIEIMALWTTYSGDTCLGVGELYFTFFSQSATRHQLVFSSTKINDLTNDYRDHTLENLYFNKSEVESLYKDISEETLKNNLDKVKKQQDVESLFN